MRDKVDRTGAGMAVALVTWEALETCTLATSGSLTCYKDAENQFFPAGQPCDCTFNADGLRRVLDQLAGDRCTTETGVPGLALDTVLQIAPIFTTRRSVPAYLWKTRFDDPTMLQAFERLWVDISAVMSDPAYSERTFMISVGNEINFYLSGPQIVFSPGWENPSLTGLATSPDDKWESFGAFLKPALAKIRANDTATPLARTPLVGTTLTWLGLDGGQDMIAEYLDITLPDWPEDTTSRVLPLLMEGDVLPLTYYPDYLESVVDPGDPATESPIRTATEDAAYYMGEFSDWLGQPVILQEVGQHSSLVDPGALGAPGDPGLEDEQRVFVDQWAQSAANHEAKFVFPDGDPFNLERQELILGYSYFQLHDFSATPPELFGGCDTAADCEVPGLPAGEKSCVAGPADGRWRNHLPGVSPAARQEPDVVYDAQRGRLVLYGGLEVPESTVPFRDTWALGVPSDPGVPLGANWERITTTPAEGPSSRGSESVYIERLDSLLTVAHDDVLDELQFWQLSFTTSGRSGTWSRLTPTLASDFPPALLGVRPFGRAAYDSDSDRVFYFGGRKNDGTTTSDLLIYDLAANQLSGRVLNVEPRREPGMVLDAPNSRLIVYGGANQGVLSDVFAISLDTLDAAPLQQESTTPAPGPALPGARFEASLVGDPEGGYALLFGGIPAGGGFVPPLGDIWRLDYEGTVATAVSWRKLAPVDATYPTPGVPSPRARHGAGAILTGALGRMVLFGGSSNPLLGDVLDDTWELLQDQRKQCVYDRTCSVPSDCAFGTFCCDKTTECRPSQIGTCVIQSTCDLVAGFLTEFCTSDSDCPNDALPHCINRRCIHGAARARVCSWGLIDENGSGKPAWSEILSSSVPRLPALCGAP